MSSDMWWMVGGIIIAALFAISITSIPERLIEWKRGLWETDSNGDLPPRDKP